MSIFIYQTFGKKAFLQYRKKAFWNSLYLLFLEILFEQTLLS